jgi:excisionase family DNA binding protein
MAAQSPPLTGLLTTAQAAAYLGLAPKTLRNWRSSGRGPKYCGRRSGTRYRRSDLDAWIKANETDPSAHRRGA